jgi:hypothetical protein
MAATACGKPRCPARADVFDWTTTEYRKGCRREQCKTAHTLAEQRRRAAKAAREAEEAAVAAAAAALNPVVPAGDGPDVDVDDQDDVEVEPATLVLVLRRELAANDPGDHPFAATLGGTALALANEIAMRSRTGVLSSASAARQLRDTLDQLRPKEAGDDDLETFLSGLSEDDDEAELGA